MAHTATTDPESPAAPPPETASDTDEYVVQPAPQEPSEPTPEARTERRGKPRAVPLLIHGTNATGIAAGAAYAAAGVPGLVAAGLAGGAAGAAALAGRKRRRSNAAARRAAARTAATRYSGGTLRRSGGGGGGRSGSPTGRSGRGSVNSHRPRNTGGASGPGNGKGRNKPGHTGFGGNHGPGRNNRGTGPGKGGPSSGARGPGSRNSGKGARRDSGSGSKSSKDAGNTPSKTSKAWQTLRGWANKARRAAGGSSGDGGGDSTSNDKTKGSSSSTGLRRLAGAARWSNGKLFRLRRVSARKLGHWARCTGAGVLATLGSLLTLPLGIAWGMWRLITNHRDPLGGFAFPVRIAGRIWRFFFRRSKARHDDEAQADALNLTVNDPRRDTDPVSGTSLVSGTAVLDGRTSKFALSMNAARDGYTGFRPTHMTQVAAEYAGLPNGIRSVAWAVRYLAEKSADQMPCSKRAIAKLVESYERLLNTARRSEDMVQLFRTAHAFDIQRIREPRTNEWMWNVTPIGTDAPEGALLQPGRLESGCVLMSVLYRSFTPTHMLQVGSEFQGMSYGLTALAEAVQVLHERTRDQYPVDDRVTDEIGGITGNCRAAADFAGMAAKLFVEDHQVEISHNTQPRKGPAAESMWNAHR